MYTNKLNKVDKHSLIKEIVITLVGWLIALSTLIHLFN